MTRHYYSLRLKGNFVNKSNGDLIKNATDIITIGESADCDIQLPSLNEQYIPEYYATIVPNADGESWRIIKRSPFIDVNILGHGEFAYACNLNDGDTITFEGSNTELVFHTHHDENFNGSISVTPSQNKQWLYISSLVAILVAFIVLNFTMSRNTPISLDLEDIKSQLQSSVYMIKVDSIAHIEKQGNHTSVVKTIRPQDETIYGTAFLTSDSLLITARHCVEYWLGEPISLTTRIANLDDDNIIRIASLVETFNQEMEDSSTHQLRVYCSVVPHDTPNANPLFQFTSDADSVFFDKSRDGIITLDDFENRYYWRTITPYFNRRDMELGDWIAVKVPHKGNFELADTTTINQINANEPLAFLGFMENEAGPGLFEAENGVLKLWNKETIGKINITHSGNITHGYSGGPVIMQHNGKYFVIGIISKVDDRNNALKRSVPIQTINISKPQTQQL